MLHAREAASLVVEAGAAGIGVVLDPGHKNLNLAIRWGVLGLLQHAWTEEITSKVRTNRNGMPACHAPQLQPLNTFEVKVKQTKERDMEPG